MESSGAPPAIQPSATPAPKHPIAFIFHVGLKIAAVVWYWICEFVFDSFVINFVVCLVLLAMDFWATKNVTGRLLVGLRYWNESTETGGSAWRFETLPEGGRAINPHEKRVFWLALMAMAAHWILATVIAIFGLSSFIIISIIGLLFAGSNLFGFFKCSREAQADVKNMISQGSNTLMQGAIKQQLNSALNRV